MSEWIRVCDNVSFISSKKDLQLITNSYNKVTIPSHQQIAVVAGLTTGKRQSIIIINVQLQDKYH